MKLPDLHMKLNVAKWFVFALLTTVAVMAESGYTGPGSDVGKTTVAAILKQPKDNMRVMLNGHIIRQIKHEHYIFNDGTGDIQVDIDDKDFPAQPISAKTKMEIVGKVDMDKKSAIEIDVKSLRILQ